MANKKPQAGKPSICSECGIRPETPGRGECADCRRVHKDGDIPTQAVKEWSGSPDPSDPDNFWIDDVTGERVNAKTGERTQQGANK